MKTTPLVLKCVATVVGAGLLAVPSLKANTETAADNKAVVRTQMQRPAPVQRIVLVQTTGSLIPQRVVISGNQVNSASPLFVLQSRDLLRTGATDVAGMLRTDPSIFVGRGRH